MRAMRGLAPANAGTGRGTFNARAGGLLLIGAPTSANLGLVMALAYKAVAVYGAEWGIQVL
jgi:hypothetical protein